MAGRGENRDGSPGGQEIPGCAEQQQPQGGAGRGPSQPVPGEPVEVAISQQDHGYGQDGRRHRRGEMPAVVVLRPQQRVGNPVDGQPDQDRRDRHQADAPDQPRSFCGFHVLFLP
jgi:hypothetical protein